MNENLLKNNYLLVPNFIDVERAKSLSVMFDKDHEKNKYSGDPQAPRSACVYGYSSAQDLLIEKVDHMSEIVGEKVLPTYSYSRIYNQNEELIIHTDRPACEISASVNLNQDEVWTIFVEDCSGNPQEINLNPGDAIVFLGCVALHWREKFKGTKYHAFFLHYVRENGIFSKYQYDENNPPEEKHPDLIEELKKEYRTMGWDLPSTDLKQYIVQYNNVLSKENCDAIISRYENSDLWKSAITAEDEMENNISSKYRICDTIAITEYEDERDVDQLLYDTFDKAVKKYFERYQFSSVSKDEGYFLLRYYPGGKYVQHVDSGTKNHRAITTIIALNDEYEGGELKFFDGQYSIRLRKGSAVVFPSSFTYPHQIAPITSGVRYSVVTLFV